VTFWSLKHFGHQLAAVLKLTTTVFFAYIFEHSDRHYYFFWVISKTFRSTTEKNLMHSDMLRHNEQ